MTLLAVNKQAALPARDNASRNLYKLSHARSTLTNIFARAQCSHIKHDETTRQRRNISRALGARRLSPCTCRRTNTAHRASRSLSAALHFFAARLYAASTQARLYALPQRYRGARSRSGQHAAPPTKTPSASFLSAANVALARTCFASSAPACLAPLPVHLLSGRHGRMNDGTDEPADGRWANHARQYTIAALILRTRDTLRSRHSTTQTGRVRRAYSAARCRRRQTWCYAQRGTSRRNRTAGACWRFFARRHIYHHHTIPSL